MMQFAICVAGKERSSKGLGTTSSTLANQVCRRYPTVSDMGKRKGNRRGGLGPVLGVIFPKRKRPFSVPNAISYLQKLPPAGRKAAAEYMKRAQKRSIRR